MIVWSTALLWDIYANQMAAKYQRGDGGEPVVHRHAGGTSLPRLGTH